MGTGEEIVVVVAALLVSILIIGSISEGDLVTGVKSGSDVEAFFGFLFAISFMSGALAGFWTGHLIMAIGLSVVLFVHSFSLLAVIERETVTSWIWDSVLDFILCFCAAGGMSAILFREFGWIPLAVLIAYSVVYALFFKKTLTVTKF